MRKILALLIAFMVASPAYAGNLCGGGIICIEQNTSFTNANAATPTTLTLFTCNSAANGCLVSAIMLYGNMTNAVSNAMYWSLVNNGVSVKMFSATPQPFQSLNMLVNSIYPPVPLPNSPVDANGNPVLFMTPGAYITATTTQNIPASGPSSGSLDLMVYAQQY